MDMRCTRLLNIICISIATVLTIPSLTADDDIGDDHEDFMYGLWNSPDSAKAVDSLVADKSPEEIRGLCIYFSSMLQQGNMQFSLQLQKMFEGVSSQMQPMLALMTEEQRVEAERNIREKIFNNTEMHSEMKKTMKETNKFMLSRLNCDPNIEAVKIAPGSDLRGETVVVEVED